VFLQDDVKALRKHNTDSLPSVHLITSWFSNRAWNKGFYAGCTTPV